MIESKPAWQSKAVWGGIIAIAGAIGNMAMKQQITPEDIIAAVGGVMAIYGRVVATTVIAGNP